MCWHWCVWQKYGGFGFWVHLYAVYGNPDLIMTRRQRVFISAISPAKILYLKLKLFKKHLLCLFFFSQIQSGCRDIIIELHDIFLSCFQNGGLKRNMSVSTVFMYCGKSCIYLDINTISCLILRFTKAVYYFIFLRKILKCKLYELNAYVYIKSKNSYIFFRLNAAQKVLHSSLRY